MKRFFQNFFLNFVKVTGIVPFGLFFKPHIYYENENTPKLGRAEIAVGNHTQLMDFVMLLFAYKFRLVRVLVAEVMFRSPLLARFMKGIRCIRVDRDAHTSVDYVDHARRTLQDQDVVGIFPEGRLNKEGRDWGPMLPFNKGAVHLAMVTGAAIRPIYMHTNGGLFKSSAMLVGDPIPVQQLFGDEPTPQALEKANRYLFRRMEALRDDLKHRDGQKEHSLLTRFIRWSMRLAMRLGFGVHYHYTDEKEQGRKLKQNMIIVGNHFSYFDPPMLCTIFPKDRLHILAGEFLYEKKPLAWLLNRLGCIKVDRTRLDMESFHAMCDVLKKKRSVGLFPEGSLGDQGEIRPLKSSFVLAAVNEDVPVLPIYIGGEYKLFRKKLHVWIDVPMKMKADSLTVESIDAQAKLVEERMKYLKIQTEREMKRYG